MTVDTAEISITVLREQLDIFLNKSRNSYISQALKKSNLKSDVFKLLDFIAETNPLCTDDGKSFYILTTVQYRKLTGIATDDTANRHFNYLCALGLIDKFNYEAEDISLIQKIMNKNEYYYTLNVITIPAYDTARQNLIRERAKELLSAGVTAGNISYCLLHERGLVALADNLYFRNCKLAPKAKRNNLRLVTDAIDRLIEIQHYCTKKQLLQADTGLTQREIKNILTIYKNDLKALYRYGKPTREERFRYRLQNDKWIFRELKGKSNE